MTFEQKTLITQSFAQVERLGDIFALTFLQRLFNLEPGLRAVVRADIQSQSRTIMNALKFAVEHLDRWEEILPDLQSMGRRHWRAGIRDSQYDIMALALEAALAANLGTAFSTSVRAAWAAFLNAMTSVMKDAADQMLKGGYDTSRFVRTAPTS